MCPSLRAHLYTPADRLTELAEYEHAVRTTLAALSEGRVGGKPLVESSSGTAPYLPDEVAPQRYAWLLVLRNADPVVRVVSKADIHIT